MITAALCNYRVSEQEAFLLLHDPIAITRRDSAWNSSSSQFLSQLVCTGQTDLDPDYYYVYFIGETAGNDGIDRTYLKRRLKSNTSAINEGWDFVSYQGNGDPTVTLGPGGYNNEVNAYINVRCATTGNITLSGEQTINTTIGGSKAVVTGDRVLVGVQTDSKENGVWVVAVGAWTRATDADETTELDKMVVRTTEGANASTGFWHQTTSNPVVGVDNISFTLVTWNTHQHYMGTVLEKDGGGYVCIYSCNGPLVNSTYRIAMMESSDLINWTRVGISEYLTPSGGIQYLIPKAVRVGNTVHLFTHNFGQGIGTEGRIFEVRYYTFTWNDDPAQWAAPTLQNTNLFHGKILGNNYGNIGEPWWDGQKFYFYSTKDAKWGYPGIGGRLTENGIQGSVVLFSTSDWVTFTEEETIFSGTQLVDIGYNCWTRPMTHLAKEFLPITAYRWRVKQNLNSPPPGVSEPAANVKLLHKTSINQNLIYSNEVYPSYLENGYLVKVDQPQEASLTPFALSFISGVAASVPVTIVGSPTRGDMSSIQAASGSYLRIDENVIKDNKYFGIKVNYETASDFDSFPMLWFGKDDGTEIFKVYSSLVSVARLEVTARDGNGLYKQYRGSATLSTIPRVEAFLSIGFLWRNGVLQLIGGYNGNLTILTQVKDDSFTDLGSIGNQLRIGASFTESDFCQHLLQNVLILNGIDNATEDNFINSDVI